jgi:putative transposase
LNWSDWLAEGDDPETLEMLRRNAEKGLPCGTEKFIQELEKLAGRSLRYRPLGRPRCEKAE